MAAIRLELKEQGGLPLCPMLSFLDLHGNQIAAETKLILRAAWSGEPLNLLVGESAAGDLRRLMLAASDSSEDEEEDSRITILLVE